MKVFSLLFLLLAVASSVFAGTKEDLEQVQRNVIDLQRQFWDLGKQLESNSANFQNTAKSLQTTTDELRDNQATLNSKLESILNQMQALNEKLDETNRRLKDLSSAGLQRPMIVTPNNAAPDQNSGTTGAPPGGAQVTQPAQNPGSTQPVGGIAGVPEQQLYQESLAQYTRGKYEQALRGFQDLLDQYPSSAYADDAQYMIGESYYGMKEYVDAVTEYDKVIKRYPDSDKVPGARLKKSFSLFSLGKKGQAVVELQQIVQLYPSSKEAQIARQRLAELGLD